MVEVCKIQTTFKCTWIINA